MPDVPIEAKFTICTGMGRSSNWSKLGLTDDQIQTLNDIGYGSNRKYSGFEEYLNTLDSFEYKVRLVRADSGDFSEMYEITKIATVSVEGNSYTGYLSDVISLLQNKKNEYVTIVINDASEVLRQKEKEAKILEKESLLNRLKKLELEINQL